MAKNRTHNGVGKSEREKKETWCLRALRQTSDGVLWYKKVKYGVHVVTRC